MCEPRRVSGRAQRTARGLTASSSLVQIDVQRWGHWASALRLTPMKTSSENALIAVRALRTNSVIAQPLKVQQSSYGLPFGKCDVRSCQAFSVRWSQPSAS
jgi:hypothetical protein